MITVVIPFAIIRGNDNSNEREVTVKGVRVKVSGEAGYAVRNAGYEGLLCFPWAGATTIASASEQCSQNAHISRIIISWEKNSKKQGH